MNYFIQNMISSYATHTESFFTPQFLVNHPVYAITVIFIYLLSDKPFNEEFFFKYFRCLSQPEITELKPRFLMQLDAVLLR